VTLAALARDFAARKAAMGTPKPPEPVRVNLSLPGAPVGEVEEVPEHFTAEQVVVLWAEAQKFRPDKESARRQMDAARWLAKQPAEHVTRALYGIGHVFPYSKGEVWTLADVRLKWTQALQESEKHPALVDARTARVVNERVNGAGS
jgi:hypothetical protein